MPGKRGKGGPDRSGRDEKQGGNQPKKTGGDKGKEVKFEFGGESGGAPTFNFGGSSENAQILTQAAKQGLVPLLQQKMAKLVGQSSGYFETLSAPVQNRIKVLKKLHYEKVSIDADYKKELAELEKKYKQKYQPLYSKREEIVNGKVEPTEEEIKVAEEEIKKHKKEEEEEEEEEKKGEKSEKKETPSEGKTEEKKETPAAEGGKTEEKKDEKGIPNFWLYTLDHNDEVNDMITTKDREALAYLVDIKVSPVEGQEQSFSLDFHFAKNPFFENEVLKKTYNLDYNDLIGDVMLDKIQGTEIQWYPGKNLTIKKITQKVGGGRRGRKGGRRPERTEVVEVPAPSFFNFFSPEAAMAQMGGDDEDEFEEEDMQGMIEDDYELGLIFKDQIIPNAVLWFTGEAQQEFGLDFGEDDEDDDEEGEEDEEGGEGGRNYFENDENYKSDEDPDFQPDPNQPPGQPECKQQ